MCYTATQCCRQFMLYRMTRTGTGTCCYSVGASGATTETGMPWNAEATLASKGFGGLEMSHCLADNIVTVKKW